MTEPGNINQLLPKGQDWIPRELADLRRLIRRQSARSSPPSSGGGITAFARYDDEAVPSTSTAYVIDPSSLGDTEGDAGSYFAYNNAGSFPGVQMTSLGWYQVFVHVQVDPITAGSVVHVRIHWPTAGFDTDAYAVDFGAGVSLSALTLPSKNYDTDGLITVTVDNPAGGTINTAQVHVLKWPGV